MSQFEWALLKEILYFPDLVLAIATPKIPAAPQLPHFEIQRVSSFENIDHTHLVKLSFVISWTLLLDSTPSTMLDAEYWGYA